MRFRMLRKIFVHTFYCSLYIAGKEAKTEPEMAGFFPILPGLSGVGPRIRRDKSWRKCNESWDSADRADQYSLKPTFLCHIPPSMRQFPAFFPEKR